MDWQSALKAWRSKGGKGIPKKGSDAYNEVKSIMAGGKVENVGGQMVSETAGGFKTGKGIEPIKAARKKKINKSTHHPSGRKIRSDKGKKREVKAKTASEKIMLAEKGPEVVKKKRKAMKKQAALLAPGESYAVKVDASGKVKKKMIKDKSGTVVEV